MPSEEVDPEYQQYMEATARGWDSVGMALRDWMIDECERKIHPHYICLAWVSLAEAAMKFVADALGEDEGRDARLELMMRTLNSSINQSQDKTIQ